MAKTKIGKVGITPKGAYSNERNYVRLDVVTENGSSYVCLKDCVGKDVTDTEYWQLVAEKGDKGDKPVNGTDYNTDAEKTEFKNDVVTETKTDIADYVTEQKTELNTYTETKKGELDEYESTKETELNTKATELTNAFNTNATSKTKYYDDNATAKTTNFDNNATEKTTAYNDNATAKIESYNTNATQKFEEYNENATSKVNEFNENVDSLNNKITKLENENDDLYNALYTEKTNGTEIYIEDAKKCRLVNTEIDGKYKQDSTVGKQLANFKNVSNVAIVDGTANLSTKTAGFTAQFNIDELTLHAGNYCFYFAVNEYGSGSTQNLTINENVVGTFNFLTKGYNYCDFILTEDITFGTLKLWLGSEWYNKTLKEISLIQGTHTDISDYEKYTGGIASPNPNYPQKIDQIEEIKYCETGKNCYDISKYNEYTQMGSFKGHWIYLKANTTYTISTNIVSNPNIGNGLQPMLGNPQNQNAYIVVTTDITATSLTSSNGVGTTSNKTRTITTGETGAIFVGARVAVNALPNMVKQGGYIQIEEGTVATEHEEYKEQIINIDLKGNKLCAVSDVIKDKLLIDKKGNVALQKNVEYVKFTSQERWNTNGEAVSRYGYITPVLNILANSNENMYISNIAVISNTANAKYNAVLSGTTASSKLRVYIPKTFLNSELTQLGALNELLQKTPMELYYKLATPEIIDLGQIDEIPSTFEGTNNIWVETNLGNTEIEIEYVQDVKKLIEQTQAMIINNASEEVTE